MTQDTASRSPRDIAAKILDRDVMCHTCNRCRENGQTIVFTNGAFDILHVGHIDYLTFSRRQGDMLVVGLNSDASVKRYKGEGRPIVQQTERARVLAALEMVDYVVIFDEDEPIELIASLLPDVLVKGEDWAHYVAGREIVEQNGGNVELAPLTADRSSSRLINLLNESGK